MIFTDSMFPTLNIFLRDVRETYTQAGTKFSHTIFISPPPDLNIHSGYVLRSVDPLYYLAESSTNWSTTYKNSHTKRIEMVPYVHEPCLLAASMPLSCKTLESPKTRGISCIQTVHALNIGNYALVVLEAQFAHRFFKESFIIVSGFCFLFPTEHASLWKKFYRTLEQPEHLERLRSVPPKASL